MSKKQITQYIKDFKIPESYRDWVSQNKQTYEKKNYISKKYSSKNSSKNFPSVREDVEGVRVDDTGHYFQLYKKPIPPNYDVRRYI